MGLLLQVSEAECRRLHEVARSADAGWVERERVEMVLLAAEGWSAPRIGTHLGWSTATVRRVLRAYIQRGPEALFPALRGRKPDVIAIDRGLIADRAAVARKLGLTRARVTQLLDLTLLAPELQVAVLTLEAIDGAEPMAERTLRAVAHAGTWAEQRATWAKLSATSEAPGHPST